MDAKSITVRLYALISFLNFVSYFLCFSAFLLLYHGNYSMIPVAYDNAQATAKPQLPKASKLVMVSFFFGVVHTSLALIVFFVIERNDPLQGNFSLEMCTRETRGFIWFYLILATEFMIFSARTGSFFWESAPSIYLLVSVFGTAVIGSLIASLSYDVPGSNIGWVWLMNAVDFVIVDAAKVLFKRIIRDAPGPIIVGDGLVEVEEKTEAKIYMEKQKRYKTHSESVLAWEDRYHNVEVVDAKKSCFSRFFGDLQSDWASLHISNYGFIHKHQHHGAPDPPPES
jgi:vacuolar-type H+-ATPase subunit I/STV1